MPWPLPTELAILTVNGQNYQEWETVSVGAILHFQIYVFGGHAAREQPRQAAKNPSNTGVNKSHTSQSRTCPISNVHLLHR